MITTPPAGAGARPVRPYWSGGTSTWTLAYIDTGTPVPGLWHASTPQRAAERGAAEGFTVIITADQADPTGARWRPDAATAEQIAERPA